MSKYNLFIETNDAFIPAKAEGTYKELPSGCYSPEFNQETGQVLFHKLKLNCDSIIDLPSKEYEYVTQGMRNFLKGSTKEKFVKEGFLYKRSVLLHGKPGTGKTVIVNRVTQEALSNNAIVLFNPYPGHLQHFFQALECTAPEKLTLVIFEEFDDLARAGTSTEKALLSVLDGEVQKNNIIYLATTNYIDNIPLRMQRPGRFSSVVEVGFPSPEARVVYLKTKKVPEELLKSWVDTTDGFSIDELKETVLAVKCLDESLTVVVDRLKSLKERGLTADPDSDDDDLEDDFNNPYGAMLKQFAPMGKKGRR